MDEMDRLFRQSDFSAENEGLEMMMQAMQCKDADELIALAKTGGYEITKEEAETYMAELEDFELEDEQLKLVAGGKGWQNCQEPDSH